MNIYIVLVLYKLKFLDLKFRDKVTSDKQCWNYLFIQTLPVLRDSM